MQPYRGLLTALIIAGLALANGPSLAKQRGSYKIRQPVPTGREVLQAKPPDLEISQVAGTLVKKCVGPSYLGVSFDVQVKNVGGQTADLGQNPWAAWLRVRDVNWNIFSPYSLADIIGPPPTSLTPQKATKFHVSKTPQQNGSGGWLVEITADPYNWILEGNESNNSLNVGQSPDSICK